MIETFADTKSQLLKGEVLAKGPKASVEPGQHVLFTQACKEENPDGTMWIRDADLVAVVEPDTKVLYGTSPFYDRDT